MIILKVPQKSRVVTSQESSWIRRAPGTTSAAHRIVRSNGTYLVTGGLGALGLRVAGWLAERGAGTIALMARRQPSEEVERQLAEIRQKGSRVAVIQGDSGALAPKQALPPRSAGLRPEKA